MVVQLKIKFLGAKVSRLSVITSFSLDRGGVALVREHYCCNQSCLIPTSLNHRKMEVVARLEGVHQLHLVKLKEHIVNGRGRLRPRLSNGHLDH